MKTTHRSRGDSVEVTSAAVYPPRAARVRPRRAGRRARIAGAALFATIALGGCGGGNPDDAGTSAPMAAPGRWVVLGSSTAAGVGSADGTGWVARLSAQMQPLGVSITNLARSGLQSSQALPMGTPVLPERPPPDPTVNVDRALEQSTRLVLLAFPTNDATAGVPAAETVEAWRIVQASAKQAGATTLVLSTQPRAGLTPAQQATLAQTDREAHAWFGPCFVPLHAALADARGEIAAAYSAGDGIHLNAAGHALVHERVRAVLDAGQCVRLTATGR